MNFKQRMEEIKRQRIASEQLNLNNKIMELKNFNPEERLKENEMHAIKDLSEKRKGLIMPGVVFGSGAGLIGLGAAVALTTTGVGAIVAGPLVFGGLMVGANGLDFVSDFPLLFRDQKKHNVKMVEEQLKTLQDDIKHTVVNKKTSVSDFYNATKDSIKESFKEMKSFFSPTVSVEDVSKRINKMRESQREALKNMPNKLRANM